MTGLGSMNTYIKSKDGVWLINTAVVLAFAFELSPLQSIPMAFICTQKWWIGIAIKLLSSILCLFLLVAGAKKYYKAYSILPLMRILFVSTVIFIGVCWITGIKWVK